MRIGVNLQADLAPAEFVAHVRFVEAAGFDALWLADSTLTYRQVFVYLTLAAEHSHRLTVGSAVNHPHVRHPADSLAALAAVDELSGGRAALGFGTGDHWVEHAGARIARLGEVQEAIRLMRGLLLADQPIDFAGEHFRLRNARLPYRLRKELPMYLAASNPRMLALAGELADGVIAFVGANLARAGRARGQAASDRPGFDFVLACHCSLDLDGDRAVADAATRLPFLERSASHLLAGFEGNDPARALALAGTPEQAIERLRRLADAGFDHLLLLPRGERRRQTLELLAERVLPAVAR